MSHNTVKTKHAELSAALSNSEELLQTLLTGLSGSSTRTGGGYMGQLADARAKVAQAATEAEQSVMKLGMAEKDLTAYEARYKDMEREAGDGKRQLAAAQAEIEKFRRKVAETGWSAEREAEVETALKEARSEVRLCTEVSHK